MLVEATDFSTTQAAVFLSGTAIGRMVFQPIMGQFISPKNCLQVYVGALIGLMSCSFCLFLFSNPVSLLLCSRLLEGAFFSGFIISWRTQLNRFSQAPNFESVNDSYVISQNAGRLAVPMAGGILNVLSTRTDSSTLNFIFKKLNPKVLFIDRTFISLLDDIPLDNQVKIIVVDVDGVVTSKSISDREFIQYESLIITHRLGEAP
ncbi:hypothetical protein [Photorhabdus khanii]|uniref:hypothetical protein n=1 Tax=Photorhabdus khanii TaxID=1004150 RepID=UPI001EF0644F|nr:hypothetical protein [Photorhabdus khanii]